MITLEDALARARSHLDAEFPDSELVIVDVLERPVGWGIVYQSRKYLETKNPDYMIIGPGPLLVLRTDGSVVELMTFQSLDAEIRDFARSQGFEA